MDELRVVPIDPERLQVMLASGHDDLGNPIEPWPTHGWEPLRCCLRIAERGEQVALVSYRPFAEPSPWAEVGPVFVHLAGCPGYPDSSRLPDRMRTGPRVLRTYHADGSLDYEDTTRVSAGQDVEPVLRDLLSRADVALVHVRADTSQCFTYEVRRG